MPRRPAESMEGYREPVVVDPAGYDSGEVLIDEKPRRTCLGHLKRWWWLILIIFIIVVLAVLLPVFLVALPKTIQDKVDAAQLTIQGMRITDPQPDSVYIQVNSTLVSASSPLTATFDPFNASLYLEDKQPRAVFGYLQMPSTTSKPITAVNISETLQIYDQQAYTDFNTWFLLNETFRMTISGETWVHVKGLRSTKVNFTKTVTLQGLNGLAGLNVTSSQVSLKADAQGDNFHGFVNVPNPSVLTLEIGNATFINLLNSTSIGTSYLDNMLLVPGANNISIRANISQAPILAAVTSQPYCESGVVPLSFVGQSVISNGEELGYFEAGLRENKLVVGVDVGKDLEAATGLTIGCKS